MTRVRWITFVGLIVIIGTLACISPRVTFAADPMPFIWDQYKAKDGILYDYPQWNDVGNGKREILPTAQGLLTFAANPKITKVILKVFKHGPQGGWNGKPVITHEMNPLPTYTVSPRGWMLIWKDINIPKIQFDEGEEIKIRWTITTKDQKNVEMGADIDLYVTVDYHAF